MTINTTTWFAALSTDDRNAWLSRYDPEALASAFHLGFYDKDRDRTQDSDEGTYLFQELQGYGQVYVLTLAVDPQTGLFSGQIWRKASNGSLLAIPAGQLGEGGYRLIGGAGFALTEDTIDEVRAEFEQAVESLSARAQGGTGYASAQSVPASQRYYGWAEENEENRRNNAFIRANSDASGEVTIPAGLQYDPDQQGGLPPADGRIGGWGNQWIRYVAGQDVSGGNLVRGGLTKKGDGLDEDFHYVSAYEAYEAALSGQNWTGRQWREGNNRDWAAKNGITLEYVRVTVNGQVQDTMGFTATVNGLVYNMYWDPSAGCNRIGRVSNSQGQDLTAAVLDAFGHNQFSLSWTGAGGIQNVLSGIAPSLNASGSSGVITDYGADFTAENTSGSAEAPTREEKQRYEAFRVNWSSYFTNGVMTRLPESRQDRERLLADLLTLNASHIMLVFCGSPTDARSRSTAENFNLFIRLVDTTSTTGAQLEMLAESMGKLMYLVGRELARNGNTKNVDARRSIDYFTVLQRKVGELVDQLILKSTKGGEDHQARQRILFNFMLGLQNYSGGDVSRSMLSPEQTLVAVARALAIAGDMDSPSFKRENASRLADYGKDIVEMLSKLMGIERMSARMTVSSELRDDQSGFGKLARESLLTVYSEEQAQRLLNTFYSMLSAYASGSPEASATLNSKRESLHEDSRKMQDQVFMILERIMDIWRDASNRIFSSN